MRAALIALALVAVPGCLTIGGASSNAIPMVRVQASSDLDCPQSNIHVSQTIGGLYEAIGCARKVVYSAACEGLRCTVAPEGQVTPYRDRPDPRPQP